MSPALLALGAFACLGLSVVLHRASRDHRGGGGSPRARSVPPAAPRVAAPAGAGAAGGGGVGGGGGGGAGVVGYLARHRWSRRVLAGVAALMVLGAATAAGYPFLTDSYTNHLQSRLERQLISGKTRIAYRTGKIAVGDSLTRIRIPKIGVDTVVVEGTTQSALRAGAGHYVDSPLPCAKGNVAIAGHRVTYGKPFTDLEKLAVGDRVYLETPIGGCTYEITTAPFPVDPSDVSVVGPTKAAELTLTTCHPEHSARQRLVVHAKRVAMHQEPAKQ